MVVYVDVSFVINLGVDICLLALTASLMRQKLHPVRILMAAGVGSLYAVATLFPGTAMLQGFFIKWLCSVWMVNVALKVGVASRRPWRKFLLLCRYVAVFYAVTFAVGGAVFALHSLFAKANSPFAGLALVNGQIAWWTGISTLFTAVAIPVGLVLIRYVWSLSGRVRRDAGHVCDVTVTLMGQAVTVKAFIDTGNALLDPVSRAPVAVVWAQAIAGCLPDPLRTAALRGENLLSALYGGADLGSLASKVTIIPYRGVGGHGGSLLAIRPDSVHAVHAVTPDRAPVRVSLSPMLFALQAEPLSTLHNYDCILPASAAERLAEGSESNEHEDARTTGNQTAHSSHTA